MRQWFFHKGRTIYGYNKRDASCKVESYIRKEYEEKAEYVTYDKMIINHKYENYFVDNVCIGVQFIRTEYKINYVRVNAHYGLYISAYC